MKLYPLKFKLILKSTIWGGEDICKFKGLSSLEDGIGESWEVSSVKGSVSVVENGVLAGRDLKDIIKEYKDDVLGTHIYQEFEDTFPLLVKFIDAKSDLSIQVHPDDKLAKERHDSFGKTEMWYVVDAKEDTFLYLGFKKNLTPELYMKSVEDGTFVDYLEKHDIKAGDVFFLPSGRVHAIGAGAFIAEIQQTSDITYRIFDYNRVGADGKTRELHTDLAKDAIDYLSYDDHKTSYAQKKDEVVTLATCKYFTTNLLDLTKPMHRDFEQQESFIIYMSLLGKALIIDDNGSEIILEQGQTVLIPACIKALDILPQEASKLLEVYI